MFKNNYVSVITYPVKIGIRITPEMSSIDDYQELSTRQWLEDHERDLRYKVVEDYLLYIKSKISILRTNLRKRFNCSFDIIEHYNNNDILNEDEDGLVVDYIVYLEIETDFLFTEKSELLSFVDTIDTIMSEENLDEGPLYSAPNGEGNGYWIENVVDKDELFSDLQLGVIYCPKFSIFDTHNTKYAEINGFHEIKEKDTFGCIKAVLNDDIKPEVLFQTPSINKKEMNFIGYKITHISKDGEIVRVFTNRESAMKYMDNVEEECKVWCEKRDDCEVREKEILKDNLYKIIKTKDDTIELFCEPVKLTLDKSFF